MLTRRTLLFLAAGLAASLAVGGSAKAQSAKTDDASAVAFINAIYNSYKTPNSDGVLIDSGPKLRRYFEPQLAEAINKDQADAARHGDVGTLDWDPFIDAQDFDFKTFTVAIKDTAPGKVSATVTFTNLNLGKPSTIVLDLVTIKNAWRIYDTLPGRETANRGRCAACSS
jgi:Protein of unknown function (DUF3828)